MAHPKKTPPTLKDIFKGRYNFYKRNDHAIEECAYGEYNTLYDFARRLVFIKPEYKDTRIIIPFSQMDRELLETIRDLLIEKGGNPPTLPEDNMYRGVSITKSAKPSSP